jgi:uracil-DNA glycosylase
VRAVVEAGLIAMEEPAHDCPLCPRLVAYRAANRKKEPDWFNAPVPSFGARNARLLIVGLAPGVTGANRTGRPFTGDFAGELLYGTLIKFGSPTPCAACPQRTNRRRKKRPLAAHTSRRRSTA